MRPEPCRDRLKNNGIPRAKMLLKAHLDWLDGCPVAQSTDIIEWRTRPRIGSAEPRLIIVDRNLIRRSQATVMTLTVHFPNAMSTLVGDVTNWSRNVTAVLGRLKGAIHDNADIMGDHAFPAIIRSDSQKSLVEQVIRQHPSLNPLSRLVNWACCVSPSVRDFLIPWIVKNAAWIACHLQVVGEEQGVSTILRLADVVRIDGDECLNFLRPGLGDSKTFFVSTFRIRPEIDQFLKGLRGWRDPKSSPPERPRQPTESYGTRLVEFANWLANQDRPIRPRAIKLASQVLSYPLLQAWTNAWDRLHASARLAIRTLCQFAKMAQPKQFHSEACRVSYELEKELVEEPLPFRVDSILNGIEQLSVDRSDKFIDSLARFVATIPAESGVEGANADGIALRLAVIREAVNMHSEGRAIRYFELSRQFLLTNRHQTFQLRPWEELIESWKHREYVYGSPNAILRELPQYQWGDYFDLLSRICGQVTYNDQSNCLAAWTLKVSCSIDQAYDRYSKAVSLEDFCFDEIDTAAAMESEEFEFIELLELLRSESSQEPFPFSALKKLHVAFAEAGWEYLVPLLFRMRRFSDLTRVATQFQIVTSIDRRLKLIPELTTATVPDWAVHLPAMLQTEIATFIATFPESRLRIQSILAKHFPDQQKIQTELATLEQLVTEQRPQISHLKKRLENLVRRLRHPKAISPMVLERIREKLRAALMLDILRTVANRLQSRLAASVGREIGVCDIGKTEIPTYQLELLQGVLSLSEPYRTFGLRLLRKRWGNVGWDLEQEPANRRFLDELEARGIHTEPWLISRACHLIVEGQTQPWTLAFETNEAETLLMGYYFGTCLSPRDCNFYSAVVNAIDINKRVLYARTPQGNVMGRCLFAIGDAGAIIVFRPYCHSNQPEFEATIARLASELAAEMGTVVSHTDHVSPLVAPGWYNDGGYDLGNSIAGEHSAVRAAIVNATEQNLIPSLEAALHPLGLTPAILELVVDFPELRARPELVRPLLPLAKQCESQLGVATRISLARLAHDASLFDIASRLLDGGAVDWVHREMVRCKDHQADAGRSLELLIEYRTSAALRILRATRCRSVRFDRDETDEFRRRSFARCFEKLGRSRRSAAMQ